MPRESITRNLLAILALGALALTACSGLTGAGAAANVNVGLTEYAIQPAVSSAKAGRVTFVVKNNGKEDHELEVSSVTGRDIPDEAGLGEVEDLGPNESKSFTVDLKPGTYELACRLVDSKANPPFNHYDRGMHMMFTVQ
jgi:iron uptake system component EfeO